MLCSIYKSLKKTDTYLYLPHSKAFSDLPETLQALFSPPTLVTTLAITADRQFARFSGAELLKNFDEDGYYVQLPATQEDLLAEFKAQSRNSNPE